MAAFKEKMRSVSINNKKYKLPSVVKIPTTTPIPQGKCKRNAPGTNFYKTSLFDCIPDQSPKEKALLAVPESQVQQKLVVD